MKAENSARNFHVGLWRDPNAQAPWEWKKTGSCQQMARAPATAKPRPIQTVQKPQTSSTSSVQAKSDSASSRPLDSPRLSTYEAADIAPFRLHDFGPPAARAAGASESGQWAHLIGDLVKAIISDRRFTIEQLEHYISGERG